MHKTRSAYLNWLLSPRPLLLLVLCCYAQPAYPQGLPGRLTGTVTDSTAAVVPGANVTLTNEATKAELQTVSGGQGFFVFANVPAFTYTLTIERSGFAKWQRTGIELHPGDAINVPDIVLKVGEVTRDVTVTASPDVVIPLDSGEKSSVITARQIQNLSIVGRDAGELMKILPGIVNTNDGIQGEVMSFWGGGVGSVSVSGQRLEALDIVSDGATTLDPTFDNAGSAVTPNVDFIQEFKIQTASFSAENSKGPAVIQTVTKAGTSGYHGSAYLFARNNVFNSQDWFNNRFGIEKPQDSFYFPGFTLGGPIPKTRDKLFFFVGTEWMRQNVAGTPNVITVPTAAMRQGDFSDSNYIQSLNGPDVNVAPGNDVEQGLTDCDGDGNPDFGGYNCGAAWGGAPPLTSANLSGGRINPNSFDPGGKVLLNLYPLPNLDPAANNGFNYYSSIVSPQHRNMQRVRVDYNISDNTKLYSTFNRESEQDISNYSLWWQFPTSSPYPSRMNATVHSYSTSTSLVQVFNPTTTNEVIFSATTLKRPYAYENRSAVDRTALGYPYQGVFKNPGRPVPSITDWGGGVADIANAGGFDPEIFVNTMTITAADNITKVLHTHVMKFGAYFQYTTIDGASYNADQGDVVVSNWAGNSTGNAWADLLMGRISEYDEVSPNPVAAKRWREFSFYAQDSWKVTPRFTFEIGARFQHLGRMYENHGWLSGFDPSKYDPNAPFTDYTGIVAQYRGDNVSNSIYQTPALLVAPRIGFAYDPTGSGNTVLRGGAGAFRYRDPGVIQEVNHANPPNQQSVDIVGPLLLSDVDNFDPQFYLVRPNGLQLLDPSDRHVPTTYNWNFTLSKRLPAHTILEAAYVGSNSRYQISPENINFNPVPEGSMFPLLSDPDCLSDPQGCAQTLRPFPTYGTIALRQHRMYQNYHGFQFQAQRWTGRINYSVAYTYSKALGVVGLTGASIPQSSFDPRGRLYGILPYDRTHNLRIAFNVFLPDATRNRILGGVLNHWQVSGISWIESGAPFESGLGGGIVLNGTSADGIDLSGENAAIFVNGTTDTPVRPALTCDPRDGLEANQYVNPNCFAAPIQGNNGSFQLPYLKKPFRQNHDLSLFKNFQWGSKEHQTLQFRFSMYNFVNHPTSVFEEGDPGFVLNYDQGVLQQDSIEEFGRPIKKRGKRLIQFGLKFNF